MKRCLKLLILQKTLIHPLKNDYKLYIIDDVFLDTPKSYNENLSVFLTNSGEKNKIVAHEGFKDYLILPRKVNNTKIQTAVAYCKVKLIFNNEEKEFKVFDLYTNTYKTHKELSLTRSNFYGVETLKYGFLLVDMEKYSDAFSIESLLYTWNSYYRAEGVCVYIQKEFVCDECKHEHISTIKSINGLYGSYYHNIDTILQFIPSHLKDEEIVTKIKNSIEEHERIRISKRSSENRLYKS